MGQRRGLIDSNVLIAASDSEHRHHRPSLTLLDSVPAHAFATSPHCLSEFLSVSTRPLSQGGSALQPERVRVALRQAITNFELLSLNVSQHTDALDQFARAGGTGPRVYDYLIGQVAVVHAIPLLVTWNVRHFQPLFPTLRVATPETLLQEQ